MGAGKGGQTTSNQSSSVSIPQSVLANYQNVYGMGQAAASQPFQSYSGEFVAPVNNIQNNALGTISNAGSWIDPTYANSTQALQAGLNSAYPQFGAAGSNYGLASGVAGASMGAVNPGALNIGAYESPYQQDVVDATTAWLNQQNKQQQTDLTTNAISSGAFGGDRSGIASGVLSGQQNMANASTIAGLNNQNYAQALAAAQQQQGVGLQAGQANRAALQSGAGLLGSIAQGQAGLGTSYLNAGVAGGNAYNTYGTQALQSTLGQGQAQLGAGQVPQQTQQALDQALYNQFLQQQAYPFQTTQFLGNLAMGLGPLQGSTTTATGSQFQPQPFFSDDKLKENVSTIGHTKHGLKIIRYNYKDDPTLRIGFLASDVEKKMPEAVSKHAGLRSVDYERAARATGGVANDQSMGGFVDPGTGIRAAFAGGGGSAPGFDPGTMAAILAAQQAMYPGAAGRAGIGGSGPRGVQLTEGGRRELMKAQLPEMRQQKQEPELKQALDDAGQINKAGKDIGDLYSGGKDALVGSPAKGTVGSSGYTPASGGLVGTGGKWDYDQGWLGKQTAGMAPAANSNTITSTALAAPPAFDATDSAGWGYADGGRLRRAAGGGMSGFIPYDTGNGYIPAADYAPFTRTPAGELQKQSTGSGSGSGGSGGGGLLGNLSSLASLGKMGVSGINGLSGLFGGSGADGLPMSGLGGMTGDAAAGAAGTFGAAGAGGASAGGADALMGLFALAKRGGRIGKDGGGSVHDNTWLQIPGSVIGGAIGGIYGGPIGAIGGSKGGGDIGLMVGDAIGGNWSGVGSDALSSVEGGLQQGMQGLKMPGLARGGRAGFQDGGDSTVTDLPAFENAVPSDPRHPEYDTRYDLLRAPNPPRTTAGLAMPPRDNVVPFRNPERPGSRERGEERRVETYRPPDWAEKPEITPADIPPPATAGVAPAAAAPAVGPLPGVASSVTASPAAPKVDNFGRMLQQESGTSQFDKNGQPITSSAGARGIAQVMPTTGPIAAKLAGVPWDPELFNRQRTGDAAKDQEAKDYNLKLGRAYYDDQLKTFGDPNIASAAYNAGPDAVTKALQKQKETGQSYLSFLPKETQDYVRIVSGQGGPSSLHADLPGVAAGPGVGQLPAATTAGVAPKDRDFMDRAGDWVDRNEKYIVPALSFLGNMLSSPSRTLAGSFGQGLVGGAKALQGQQELGQGQQRIDITQRSQQMTLWANLRQMWAASVTAANPSGDPALKAQMDRLAVQIAQGGGPAPGSPDSTAGVAPANLAPTATPPAGAGVAPVPVPATAPISTAPNPPPAMPAPLGNVPPAAAPAGAPPVTANPDALPPSMRVPAPAITPAFESQLPDTMQPTKLELQGNTLKNAGRPEGQQYLDRANAIRADIKAKNGAVGADGEWKDLPGARNFNEAEKRSGENTEWTVKQQPVYQDRQNMKQSVDEIVHQLQTFEPGEFSHIKADIQAATRGATGLQPPSTSTMNAEAYQIFLKNAAAIITQAPSGDTRTDEARRMLQDAFTGPDKQPGAVRDVLAKAKGRLDYADEFLADANKKIHQEPRLDRTMLAQEFEKEHPLQSYIDKNYKDMAVRGATPDKPDDLKQGHAYIVEPEQAKRWHLPGIDKPTKLLFKGVEPDGRVRFGRING